MQLALDEVKSPIGTVLVVADADVLVGLDFADCRGRAERLLRRRLGAYELVRQRDPGGLAGRVRAYFRGELDAFEGVPVETRGTPFQQRVWRALRRIPPGSTRSYGELAATLRMPRASRAVGTANGSNPIALVLPCHRVIGSDGALHGYAGGVERKRWLLRHEGVEVK